MDDDSGYNASAMYVSCDLCRLHWFDTHDAFDFLDLYWVSVFPSQTFHGSLINNGHTIFCSRCNCQVGTISSVDQTYVIDWKFICFIRVDEEHRTDLE